MQSTVPRQSVREGDAEGFAGRADESMILKKGYADTPSGQIHFRRVEGTGIPVVLLHRTPVASNSFERMLDLLDGTRNAVAFDTPGFGQSFRPAGFPAAIDYADWFLAAIDALKIDAFHLCAHHTGTHFAAELALLAPDRVRSLLLSGVLYAGAEERGAILAEIGDAAPVDKAGAYLTKTWSVIRKLYSGFDPEIIHSEVLGALGAIDGRNQVFHAILSQDFAGVLSRIACPVGIVQAIDDPLAFMLPRVRAAHPAMPVELMGRAQTAAPELQSQHYAASLLRFAAAHDAPSQGVRMTDRNFHLVKTPTGFDLELGHNACPAPGLGEVLVKMHAVSLNRRDLMIRDFSYPVFGADRFTPLSDGAGEIVAVGPGVRKFAVGDRVCSTFFQNWRDGPLTFPAVTSALGAGGRGVLADHVVLVEDGVALIPDDWSFAEGACISCAGLTAWSAFAAGGGIRRGDWVLVLGTGGVAIFALQIAVAMGAKVVLLSSSEEKLARARKMGASATINYKATPDWEIAVKDASGGGVQHAIELGGEGTLAKSVASTAIGGHIALIGALAGYGGEISGAALMNGALRISAIAVGPHVAHLAMTEFFVEYRIRPVIDSVFDLDSVTKAYERMAEGAFGKIVITV